MDLVTGTWKLPQQMASPASERTIASRTGVGQSLEHGGNVGDRAVRIGTAIEVVGVHCLTFIERS